MPSKRPPLSILMPIYNVDKYLRQSLSSVCNQTLEDIEIICINDGSTDSSLSIIKEFMSKDPRIILINKKNSGYGDSMNQGLKKAKGEFIGIVEPDDLCATNMFEVLLSAATSQKVNVAKCGFREFQGSIQVASVAITEKPTLKSGKDLLNLPPSIWSAIYRRQFLLDNKIDFLPTPGASYQDLSLTMEVLCQAERVVLIKEELYFYRTDNSASSIHSDAKVFAVVKEYAKIEQYLHQHRKWTEFAPLIQSAKFRNYHWNFQRLDGAAAHEFYKTWRSEFNAAKASGYLQRSNFRCLDWLALQGVLNLPGVTFYILRLRAWFHKH